MEAILVTCDGRIMITQIPEVVLEIRIPVFDKFRPDSYMSTMIPVWPPSALRRFCLVMPETPPSPDSIPVY